MAHSFAPTDGRLHFDEDETIWVVGADAAACFPPLVLGRLRVCIRMTMTFKEFWLFITLTPELAFSFARFSRWIVKRDLPQQISNCFMFFL